MPDSPCLVWFRNDLRLADNPALRAAAGSGQPVVCVYVLDDETPGRWKPGGASRWWLHYSLRALGQALERKGGKLILRRGSANEEVARLAEEAGAETVFWNRCYEPYSVRSEKALEASLKDRGVRVKSFNSALLFEPWAVSSPGGDPYKVFSAYWRRARELGPPDPPEPPPERIITPPALPAGEELDAWKLLPRQPDWAGGLRATWVPGEEAATRRLAFFIDELAQDYHRNRDRPAVDGTSRLSPHLHFGEVSPRTIWSALSTAAEARPGLDGSVEKFRSELGWREFSHQLLFHFPQFPEQCLGDKFHDFPWRPDEALFRAWTTGETGYPFVDAGMRQLWETGWMHNRVRMNTASLLIKHFLQPWQDGEAWFWDTLVDADLADNSVNWQWVTGCGADAAPYFRIFNPVLQGERHDPGGDYVRRYVPELARLPDKYIHKPWEAPESVLDDAGVRLGKDYPRPLIGHSEGRRRAMDAFNRIKKTGS